jgi:hypothetical protein
MSPLSKICKALSNGIKNLNGTSTVAAKSNFQ